MAVCLIWSKNELHTLSQGFKRESVIEKRLMLILIHEDHRVSFCGEVEHASRCLSVEKVEQTVFGAHEHVHCFDRFLWQVGSQLSLHRCYDEEGDNNTKRYQTKF